VRSSGPAVESTSLIEAGLKTRLYTVVKTAAVIINVECGVAL
jgi:hypothetical protein